MDVLECIEARHQAMHQAMLIAISGAAIGAIIIGFVCLLYWVRYKNLKDEGNPKQFAKMSCLMTLTISSILVLSLVPMGWFLAQAVLGKFNCRL
jgi:cell division protein FtsX